MEEENISPEGRKEIERLRAKYVVSDEEVKLYKERELLKKLYECHDEMGELLDGGKEDIHYGLMEILIKRLENHLSGNSTII